MYVLKLVTEWPANFCTRSFYAKYEIVTEIKMKFTLLRDLKCNLVERFQRFGGICCLHHGRRVFCFEDEGILFPEILLTLYQMTRHHIPEDCNLLSFQVSS